jgi:hypothetical protein
MPRYRGSSARTRALLVLLAAVSLVALFTTKVSRKMPDFEVYRRAGARATAAEPLYRAEDGHYQFKYLPPSALIAAPFAMIPLTAAKMLWFALSAICMVLLLWLSAVTLPQPRRPIALLVVITFLAMAKFYAHELVLGQVNLLFAVVVMIALLQLRAGREALGGILLAFAVVVKPYAALFAPWLALRPNRTAFAAMIAALVMVLLAPAALYGWSQNLHLIVDWFRTVTASTPPNLTNQDNVSFAAFFAKWLGPESGAATLAVLASAVLLGLIALVVAARRGMPAPDPLEVALLMLAIPLLSPQGWDYVFLIGTPAVMLIVDKLTDLPKELRVVSVVAMAVAALSLYDVMGREAYAIFMASSAITICFVVQAVALVALRFRRAA